MKTIVTLLLFTACQFSYAGEETDIVAMSDWSQPVRSKTRGILRARMIISLEKSPASADPRNETAFYIELQNVTDSVGPPLKFYYDPCSALRCELLDADGKPPPPEMMAGNGGGAGPCWIILPYDSTIRLRANMYGYGMEPKDGFKLVMMPPSMGSWIIRPGNQKDYFMSGTLVMTPPANYVAKDFDDARTIWSGSIELPKMKILLPKQ